MGDFIIQIENATKEYKIGAPICLDVTSHIVIDPLTKVFLERFNPFPYVEAMLRQAEEEMKQGSLEGRCEKPRTLTH